jgi:hypothetical protein
LIVDINAYALIVILNNIAMVSLYTIINSYLLSQFHCHRYQQYPNGYNVRNVLTEAIMREENPRTLATEMSKQLVYRAMLLRKGAINVAREAYERLDRISV